MQRDNLGNELLQLCPHVQRDVQLEEQLDDKDILQRRKVFSRGIDNEIRTIVHLTQALVMLRGVLLKMSSRLNSFQLGDLGDDGDEHGNVLLQLPHVQRDVQPKEQLNDEESLTHTLVMLRGRITEDSS